MFEIKWQNWRSRWTIILNSETAHSNSSSAVYYAVNSQDGSHVLQCLHWLLHCIIAHLHKVKLLSVLLPNTRHHTPHSNFMCEHRHITNYFFSGCVSCCKYVGYLKNREFLKSSKIQVINWDATVRAIYNVIFMIF